MFEFRILLTDRYDQIVIRFDPTLHQFAITRKGSQETVFLTSQGAVERLRRSPGLLPQVEPHFYIEGALERYHKEKQLEGGPAESLPGMCCARCLLPATSMIHQVMGPEPKGDLPL